MIGKVCSVHGCTNISIAKGWCDKHRKRFARHGDVIFTRASDWGSRTGHPLYKLWHGLVRTYSAKGQLSKEWATDFWKFVEDVQEKPEGRYRFTRREKGSPFGPRNWHWKEVGLFNVPHGREYTREWQRKKRALDPEYNFKQALRKYFGLTAEQYYEMFEKQGGVCAICKQTEPSIHKPSGKYRRLAVDHCHASGKIRGLLCSKCNHGLGGFKDNKEYLHAAIKYLEVQ